MSTQRWRLEYAQPPSEQCPDQTIQTVTTDSIDAMIYIGKLDNEPRYIANLKIGERILFEEKR